jgi:hypothetical protein
MQSLSNRLRWRYKHGNPVNSVSLTDAERLVTDPGCSARDIDYFQWHYTHLWVPALAAAKATLPAGNATTALALHNQTLAACMAEQTPKFLAEMRDRRDTEHEALVADYRRRVTALCTAQPTAEQYAS